MRLAKGVNMKKNYLMASVVFLGGVSLGFGQIIPNNVTFQNYFPGITLQRPVYVAEVPGKDSNYVVLEQYAGRVTIVYRDFGSWARKTMDSIKVCTSGEMGLLGIAFHPNYSQNRKYYIFHSDTNCRASIVDERVADTSLTRTSGVAARQLLRYTKAQDNHNGGDIDFGADGYLYIGIGDGGNPQGDAQGRAQNPDTLLGKFLRIDVNTTSPGKQYGIPTDNPFVGNVAYRPEIWALGVRNPWRWSFDRVTGNLWAGEVGNGAWEEVTKVAKGQNLGWSLMEGFGCQTQWFPNCNQTGLTLPVSAYGHNGGDNAIIGGHVYRGNPASPFYGVYFYGDNGSGRVRAVRVVNNVKTDSLQFTNLLNGISAIGTDSHGSLYGTSVNSNQVFRFTSPDLIPVPISSRKIGRTNLFGTGNSASNLEKHDLRGHRLSGSIGRGIYVVRGEKNIPALVPAIW